MKPFTNKKGKEFLLVEVPDDSFYHWINPTIKYHIHYHTPQLEGMTDIDIHTVELPQGNYQIIGLAKDVIEEVSKTIVDVKNEETYPLYRKYEYGELSGCFIYMRIKPTESLQSLIQSLGLNDNVLILEKVKTTF